MRSNLARCVPFLALVSCAQAGSGPVMTSTEGAVGGLELDGAPAEEDANEAGAGGERKLARSAWLVFEVDDDGDERQVFIDKAEQVAEGFGGYLASESADGFTMRVPAADLDEAIAALAKLGDITARGHRVDDVTREHRDLGIRIDNAKHLKARLLALLEKTQDVKEILAVEKELSRVTLELESLEAQMRNLSRTVALATVDVRFEDDVSPGPIGWIFYGVFKGVKWLFVWD